MVIVRIAYVHPVPRRRVEQHIAHQILQTSSFLFAVSLAMYRAIRVVCSPNPFWRSDPYFATHLAKGWRQGDRIRGCSANLWPARKFWHPEQREQYLLLISNRCSHSRKRNSEGMLALLVNSPSVFAIGISGVVIHICNTLPVKREKCEPYFFTRGDHNSIECKVFIIVIATILALSWCDFRHSREEPMLSVLRAKSLQITSFCRILSFEIL
jgi:hypothetical protein